MPADLKAAGAASAPPSIIAVRTLEGEVKALEADLKKKPSYRRAVLVQHRRRLRREAVAANRATFKVV